MQIISTGYNAQTNITLVNVRLRERVSNNVVKISVEHEITLQGNYGIGDEETAIEAAKQLALAGISTLPTFT